MPDRIQIHLPLVYFFGLVISSSSRSNDAFAKLSKQRSGIWTQSTSSVYIIWLCFYLKTLQKQISHFFLGKFARLFTFRPSALGNLTHQNFRLAIGPIFWYAILEAMWYLHKIILYVKYLKKPDKGNLGFKWDLYLGGLLQFPS